MLQPLLAFVNRTWAEIAVIRRAGGVPAHEEGGHQGLPYDAISARWTPVARTVCLPDDAGTRPALQILPFRADTGSALQVLAGSGRHGVGATGGLGRVFRRPELRPLEMPPGSHPSRYRTGLARTARPDWTLHLSPIAPHQVQQQRPAAAREGCLRGRWYSG